jgi:hypothetical protein
VSFRGKGGWEKIKGEVMKPDEGHSSSSGFHAQPVHFVKTSTVCFQSCFAAC